MDLTYDDAQVAQRILIGMKADEVWVFGSRARGDFRSDSELDLLVLIPDSNEARHIRSRHARLHDANTLPFLAQKEGRILAQRSGHCREY